jgi:hypothetical protein
MDSLARALTITIRTTDIVSYCHVGAQQDQSPERPNTKTSSSTHGLMLELKKSVIQSKGLTIHFVKNKTIPPCHVPTIIQGESHHVHGRHIAISQLLRCYTMTVVQYANLQHPGLKEDIQLSQSSQIVTQSLLESQKHSLVTLLVVLVV